MKLFGTMNVNSKGHLEIGKCDTTELAKEFGTPLYVVDEDLVRSTCREFKDNFEIEGIESEVIYASKAFLNLAIAKVICEEGLSLDVVSGGELYTALKANFPVSRIYMHGNNKTEGELSMAIEAGIGRIVVDNRNELEVIEYLCKSLNKKVDVLLRVNPGIEAHTHEYIQTSKNDSKFGESIFDEDMCKIINRFQNSESVNFKGFHCHIGSQIFEEKSFYSEVSDMIKFLEKIKKSMRI
ncbi:Diaminopimelate decarboxylase [Clostridium carboxidivorans P7]|uniref:Diaminopimelate decarboxylase n=1 Tax=Clostridium carboxidivorans P7 TaxID=536227 RepID=C6PQG4_9CLOT|nr:Diaminopimelate decarboxylase [Clostridium carboxidivorans P7]